MSVKLLRTHVTELANFRWQESAQAGTKSGAPGKASASGVGQSSGAPGAASDAASTAFAAMVEQAQREAMQATAAADAKAKEAYQQGFDEGFTKASQQQRAEAEAVRSELANSLGNLVRARQQVLSEADLELVRVAMAIAEKVLNRQLQIDQDALRGVARAALERLAGKPVLAIRAHPQDQEALARALPEMEAKGLRWLPDDNLARGALQFETEFGVLDASIHTQLEEIEHGLVDHLQRSQR